MPTIPPSDSPSPKPSSTPQSGEAPSPLHTGGSGKSSFTDFLANFSPEEKKKFEDILMKNLITAMSKASKKYIEELREEREKLQ